MRETKRGQEQPDGRKRTVAGLLAASGILVLGALAGSAQAPPPPPPPGGGGNPLPGLTVAEGADFRAGRDAFTRPLRIEDGLGPVFNDVSCGACHRAGGPGGAGTDLDRHRVTRIGAVRNGAYTDLAEVGGPVLQRRSINEFDRSILVQPERVPAEAQFVSLRYTSPTFGAGLVEAIPEAAILSRADPDDRNRDGISGRPNRIQNTESGRLEVGRFGWKAQMPTVHLFTGDAMLNENGLTTPTFPLENLPQGRPLPPGADRVPDPEELGNNLRTITRFQQFLAPPNSGQTPPAADGTLFTQIGCAACHTPQMTTGANAAAALSNKPVNLYSDLLLHDMGPGLADGIRQGEAQGGEWRTAPLWGLNQRPFWLHDGRARSIEQAILAHDGESGPSRAAYQRLNAKQRGDLLAFLRAL